jgi:hypothetical protein
MDQISTTALLNSALTKTVIALHDQGYVFDFLITVDNSILCIQDNRSFTLDQVSITLVDLSFDYFTKCYKYIHTVETCCGDSGLLIDSRVCINSFFTSKLDLTAAL